MTLCYLWKNGYLTPKHILCRLKMQMFIIDLHRQTQQQQQQQQVIQEITRNKSSFSKLSTETHTIEMNGEWSKCNNI